ncbi:type II secretion system F family protein [Nocardioides sambongensis]|uniref:type II secretion system F family protein n=1 Tax=Nocardioides sambongensis TaxID=2589074 RepID=UPI00112C5220|nr:type II secretion system F family protein [Nocardioides sambongensis]
MSPALAGGLLGALAATGIALVVGRALALRRPDLEGRVLPYLRDVVPGPGDPRRPAQVPRSAVAAVYGPALRWTADAVERVLGGAPSIRRRLQRAGLETSVPDFRVEQVVWGLIGFASAAGLLLLRSWSQPVDPLAAILLAAGSFVLGVMLRENRLSAQVRRRERAIVAEFPTIAELLALSVAAGEGPVAALDRVVRRSSGELGRELAGVLAGIRTGEPVSDAFDRLGATTGVPVVARFAHGVAVAVERGTPLADVLHAQAADVREAGRRELIEHASRKEIAMMVPVVFLILPVTILFAFWPGFVGLSLTAGPEPLLRLTLGKGTTMEPLTTLLMLGTRLHLAVQERLASRDQRGDVPGWVLVTVMTITIGYGLFRMAGPELNQMLRSALNSVQ